MNKLKLAKIGEKIAVYYLITKKYLILAKNVRFKEGEIDIIAFLKEYLVFVEVKTRKSFNFGYPEEAFNEIKKQRLFDAINKYIYRNNYLGEWQVDLITIVIKNNKAWLRHYKSVEL